MKLLSEEELYQKYKPLLFSISYRMLGSVVEAEDIVQETFLTFFQKDMSSVVNQRAYLCKIATNLCLDLLKSAKKKREVYIGPWLPEPYIDSEPEDLTMMRHSLSISYLLMMEKLTPTERAVFLLRKVFGFSYKEVMDIVQKTEVNCRKIFARAREKIKTGEQNTKLDNKKNEGIILDFIRSFQNGDMNKLMELISENVILYSDGGGIVKAAIRPILSRHRVLPFLFGVSSKAPSDLETEIKMVNGQYGVLNKMNSIPHSVISFHLENGQVKEIYIVMNPEKLRHL